MIPRAAVLVSGMLALALPLPTGGLLVVTVVGVVSLGLSVVRPGSAAPAVVIVAAVLSWLATTSGPSHVARLVGLAFALSVLHASSALAAVVPAGARVPTRLALRWLGWAGAAAAVGVGALGAASLLPSGGAALLPVTVLAVGAAGLGAVLVVAVAYRGFRSRSA